MARPGPWAMLDQMLKSLLNAAKLPAFGCKSGISNRYWQVRRKAVRRSVG